MTINIISGLNTITLRPLNVECSLFILRLTNQSTNKVIDTNISGIFNDPILQISLDVKTDATTLQNEVYLDREGWYTYELLSEPTHLLCKTGLLFFEFVKSTKTEYQRTENEKKTYERVD